jgi:hypothetical protein
MNSIAVPRADVKRVIPAALVAVLAVTAGAIHLAHNYLPMGEPADAASGPPPGAAAAGGAGGLMSLVMPHLSQIMLLNFVAFVGLGIVFVIAVRWRPRLRVPVDALLVLMSAATLYAWNAMGQSNPYGTGTLALIVESGLIVLALADAALATSGRADAHQARPAVRRRAS